MQPATQFDDVRHGAAEIRVGDGASGAVEFSDEVMHEPELGPNDVYDLASAALAGGQQLKDSPPAPRPLDPRRLQSVG